jgi:DNA-binding Lrp family transcriptional regulator
MEVASSNIEDMIFEKIKEAGPEGIRQSEVGRLLGIPGSEAARAISKLIRKGLVRKHSTIVEGKRMVVLYAVMSTDIPIVVNLNSVENVPCFSCKVINKCENGSYISPQTCGKMNQWLIESVLRSVG